MTESRLNEVKFTDDDIVNLNEWTGDWENVNMYLFHDHGFVLGVVFASDLQDAYDEIADSGKLDSFRVSDEDWGEGNADSYEYLGNNSHAYDVECVSVIECRTPIRPDFCASFNIEMGAKETKSNG